MRSDPLRSRRSRKKDNLGIIRFNWACYLPRTARHVLSRAVIIIVVILTVAFTGGYGEAAVAALGAALLSAVAAEGVKAALRACLRNA